MEETNMWGVITVQKTHDTYTPPCFAAQSGKWGHSAARWGAHRSFCQSFCILPFTCLAMYLSRLHFLKTWHLTSEYIWPMEAGRSQDISPSLALSWAVSLTAVVSLLRDSCPSWPQLPLCAMITQPSSLVTGNAIFFQHQSSLMDGSSFLLL